MKHFAFVGQVVHVYPASPDSPLVRDGHTHEDPVAAIVTGLLDNNSVNVTAFPDHTMPVVLRNIPNLQHVEEENVTFWRPITLSEQGIFTELHDAMHESIDQVHEARAKAVEYLEGMMKSSTAVPAAATPAT